MVNLLFIEDSDALTKPGVVRTMYDPTAGTGGMLSVAGEYLAELNPKARLTLFVKGCGMPARAAPPSIEQR
jgi:type I restriction enzyme M protein